MPKRRWPACEWTRARRCSGRRNRSGPGARRPREERPAEGGAARGRLPAMPRGRAKLPAADIEAIAQWIRDGAVWPASTTDAAAPAPAVAHERVITPEQRAFWSFQPHSQAGGACRSRTQPGRAPTSIASCWRGSKGRASRRWEPPTSVTLIRRATLDLTGVPPTPEEIDAFLERTPRRARSTKVVDRLLASPHYGETWGRMWLDVARYGEDDYRSLDPMQRGFNPYPNAYLYRDWVIRAFNDDLPYDQFVTAQLAADLLEGPDRVRQLPALGFLGLGPWYYDNGAVEITQRRRAARPRRRRQPRLPRPDGRLRPLPRPQVRPDSDQGLLLARRRLPQHRVPRVPAGAEGGRRGVQDAREDSSKQKRRCSASSWRTEARQLVRDAGVPGRRSTCRRRGR